MSYLIVFALCLLATSKVSLQSTFAKKNRTTDRDTVLFNGLVFFTAAVLFSPYIFSASSVTWGFSALFAVFTVTFQLSYTKALSLGNVSVTVMMVNLSMLFPIVVSAVVYQETVSLIQFIGILLTVVSFILCAETTSKKSLSGRWFSLSLAALFSNAGIGITQKIFTQRANGTDKESFVACSYAAAFLLTLTVYILMRKAKTDRAIFKKPSLYVLSLSVGVVLAVFQWLNTYAIATIDGTFLFPTYSGGSILLSTLAGIVLFKDAITTRQAASIAVGVAAVVLMNF